MPKTAIAVGLAGLAAADLSAQAVPIAPFSKTMIHDPCKAE
jgi:hypothetical protein